MRLGIISDTHGRRALVDKAMDILRARKVDLVLHCGDIDDVETVALFSALPTHFVPGNCDPIHDPALRQAIKAISGTWHEPFGNLELEGAHIAWIHGDNARLFRELEQSGGFDYLFYGHTHVAEQHRAGKTLVVNPGAIHRVSTRTFLVLELPSGMMESITVV